MKLDDFENTAGLETTQIDVDRVMTEMEKTSQDSAEQRRAARRRQRVRTQRMCYMAILGVLVVLLVGIVVAFKGFIPGLGGTADRIETGEPEPGISMDEQDPLASVNELLNEEEPVLEEPQEELPPEPTYEEKLDEIVNAAIETMSLEDRVAGLFMVTPEELTGVTQAVKAGDGTKTALEQYAVGGLIYFGKNIQSADQFREMIATTKELSKYPLFMGIDEEGGSVTRLGEAKLVNKVASAGDIGATNDSANAYEAGVTIGTYLTDYGFNMDMAPVADLTSVENSIMTGRSYGSDPQMVSSMVTNMMLGLESTGITSVLKHFPGEGATTQDTHSGMASTGRTREEFENGEFQVFRAGIESGAQVIMVGHMSADSLTGDGNMPCSLSSAVVTDILRNELGFDGVIITDSLTMSTISKYYDSDEAAIMALKAGCDMILMPEDFKKAYAGVLEAVRTGVVSEERVNDSLRRIYRIKYAGMVE